MKNILIPTDFSENSWNAIQYALNLYKKTECNFYLLHINDRSSYEYNGIIHAPSVKPKEKKIWEPLKEELNKFLKRIEQLPNNARHHFFMLTDEGFFIDSIRRHVEEKKIDLIVMGTKGATGLKELIIGSNTGDVIKKVQCNTLTIPENTNGHSPKEVAFATDYNIFYSATILTAISELLQTNDASIRVMHVSKRGDNLTEEQTSNKEYLQDYLDETFEDLNSFHTITNKSVTAAIECFMESRDIDMIVMVAKNLNFLQQVLFNSKVEKVSFHTTVPFLVLHE